MITSHDPLILEQQVIRSISVITKHGSNTILKEMRGGIQFSVSHCFKLTYVKRKMKLNLSNLDRNVDVNRKGFNEVLNI